MRILLVLSHFGTVSASFILHKTPLQSIISSHIIIPITKRRANKKSLIVRSLSIASPSSSPCSSVVDRHMQIYDFDCVESTQDEARRILREGSSCSYFTVSAIEQTKGRGTSGRTWIGHRGNCFLTVAFPIDQIKIPITLVPLKIGSIVAHTIQQQLEREFLNKENNNPESLLFPRITVKWPNDVLVRERKISGVLIETESIHGLDPNRNGSWLLIGIGINVAEAPQVARHGTHRGRRAICIKDFTVEWNPFKHNNEEYFISMSKHLAKIISEHIYDWINLQKQLITHDENSKQLIISSLMEEWESHADLGKPLVLRDVEGNQEVIPISLESDGRLRVLVDGEIRLLSSDYLL